MSELERFAQQARRMSTAEHKPECAGTPERVAEQAAHILSYRRIFREDHPKLNPIDPCPGCVTDSDRELWARLATEAEAWLARNVEEALPI